MSDPERALDLFRLDDRVVIVTGASSGLGERFARVVAGVGASVVLAARRIDRLEVLAAELPDALAVECDVTSLDGPQHLIDATIDHFGRLDVLINNAGMAAGGLALDLSEDDWNQVMDTNLKGAWTVAQEAAKRMAAAETGGVIVNIASVLGLRVSKGVVPYAVSKAGLIQMTKALALELAVHDIRVNALAPGYVETDLTHDYLAGDAGKALLKRIPQRRPADMTELDGPLLLLCSDASSYMTGAVLAVDGGHLVSSL